MSEKNFNLKVVYKNIIKIVNVSNITIARIKDGRLRIFGNFFLPIEYENTSIGDILYLNLYLENVSLGFAQGIVTSKGLNCLTYRTEIDNIIYTYCKYLNTDYLTYKSNIFEEYTGCYPTVGATILCNINDTNIRSYIINGVSTTDSKNVYLTTVYKPIHVSIENTVKTNPPLTSTYSRTDNYVIKSILTDINIKTPVHSFSDKQGYKIYNIYNDSSSFYISELYKRSLFLDILKIQSENLLYRTCYSDNSGLYIEKIPNQLESNVSIKGLNNGEIHFKCNIIQMLCPNNIPGAFVLIPTTPFIYSTVLLYISLYINSLDKLYLGILSTFNKNYCIVRTADFDNLDSDNKQFIKYLELNGRSNTAIDTNKDKDHNKLYLSRHEIKPIKRKENYVILR